MKTFDVYVIIVLCTEEVKTVSYLHAYSDSTISLHKPKINFKINRIIEMKRNQNPIGSKSFGYRISIRFSPSKIDASPDGVIFFFLPNSLFRCFTTTVCCEKMRRNSSNSTHRFERSNRNTDAWVVHGIR